MQADNLNRKGAFMRGLVLQIEILLVLMLLVSCEKENGGFKIKIVNGVQLTTNRNHPNQEDFKITPTLSYKINFDDYIHSSESGISRFFTVDSNENLFTFHSKTMTVRKYDKNGKFIKEFAGRGNGPGELGDHANNVDALLIDKNLLKIYMPYQKQILTYDLNGNFINSQFQNLIKYNTDRYNLVSNSIIPVDSHKIIQLSSLANKENHRHELHILNIRDGGVKFKEILSKNSKKSKDYVSFMWLKHTYREGKIYVAQNSKDVFQIDIYDTLARKIKRINKFYKKVKYPFIFRISTGIKHCQSILDIQVDKDNRIWIASSEDNEMSKIVNNDTYQIFNNEGVYLNKLTLDLDISIQNIFFLSDKMFVYGVGENGDDQMPLIYVFDY